MNVLSCSLHNIQQCQSFLSLKTFDNEIDVNDIDLWYDDLAKGLYKKWIEKYPHLINEIFELYLIVCENLKIEDIKFFEQKGIVIDSSCYGTTYLCKVCETRNYEAIKILLESGANPNLRGVDGRSPLDWCLVGSPLLDTSDLEDADDYIKLLFSYGSDNVITNKTMELLQKRKKSDYIIQILDKTSVVDVTNLFNVYRVLEIILDSYNIYQSK